MVAANGTLTLEEPDDFTRFHISTEHRDGLAPNYSTAFQAIADDAGNAHYWLNADAIAELSPLNDDQQWLTAFWDMLAKAERFGFYDAERRVVKAHVERSQNQDGKR
jgi:hypothetical protein